MCGDIAKAKIDFGFGAITAGARLEWSNTYRQQRDVDLVTGGRNYIEKAVVNPVNQVATRATPTIPKNSSNSNFVRSTG